MLDNLRLAATPEGIAIHLSLAGPVPRALAWVTDLLLRVTVYLACASALGFFGFAGWGPVLIIAFVLDWFYPVLFECLGNGATPGKRLLGLRVVHSDGTPVGWTASLIRNTLRFIDVLPLAYGVGALWMLFSRDFQRLGDLAAGTVVVHSPRGRAATALPAGPAAPPPFSLAVAERRCLLDFAHRQAGWGAQRAAEIAEQAPSLTGGSQGAAAVAQLLAQARYLAGVSSAAGSNAAERR